MISLAFHRLVYPVFHGSLVRPATSCNFIWQQWFPSFSFSFIKISFSLLHKRMNMNDCYFLADTQQKEKSSFSLEKADDIHRALLDFVLCFLIFVPYFQPEFQLFRLRPGSRWLFTFSWVIHWCNKELRCRASVLRDVNDWILPAFSKFGQHQLLRRISRWIKDLVRPPWPRGLNRRGPWERGWWIKAI